MVDLDAVFLERQHVGAVVVLVNPAVPHLRIGFLRLVAVGGAVLDEGADCGVDDGVVLPEGIAQVALQQQVVLRLLQRGHQQRVAVADVAALVGLHRKEHGRQRVVAVARGFRRHGDEKRVGERRLGDDGQIHAGGRHRIAGDEAFTELAADRGRVALAEGFFRDIEPCRVDVVLHVPLLQIHLDGRVTELVDHLHGESGPEVLAGRQPRHHRHRTGGGNFREGNDGEEQLHPLHPARLDIAEHVAAQRRVERAVDAVVLLLLHREVGAQHLLHRIARRLGDLVVGRKRHRFLDIGRVPTEVGNLLGRLAHGNTALRGYLVKRQRRHRHKPPPG